MSSTRILHRYICILKALERGEKTIDQIRFAYEKSCDIKGYTSAFSSRQFLRDKLEILSIFNVDIKCKQGRGMGIYYLDDYDRGLLNKPMKLTDMLF